MPGGPNWQPVSPSATLPGVIASLAPALTAVRLTLHVLAASVWVGGQIVVGGLVPTLRSMGGDASKRVAQAFGRIQWPAFLLLVVTGIWNVAASSKHQPHAWQVVLGVKIGVVALAGASAFLHQRSTSKAGLAAWGAVAGVSSLA